MVETEEDQCLDFADGIVQPAHVGKGLGRRVLEEQVGALRTLQAFEGHPQGPIPPHEISAAELLGNQPGCRVRHDFFVTGP
jgi:hypothetical protein